MFNMFNSFGMFGSSNKKNTYNPLINYDWSTTTAKEYKTDGVELVVNGGFDSSDTSNLRPYTATVSIVEENGAGRFISTEAWRYVEDSSVFTYPFVVGETYLYKFDILETNASIRVGNASKLLVVAEAGSYEFAFTYQSGLARGLRINAYTTPVNALIDNISVQKVIQEPNKRYLKDVGSTPTYNASMYFGIGAYLNGVDQYIPFTLNLTDMQTVAVRLKREVGKNIRLFGRGADLVCYFNFDLTFTRIRFATGVEFQFPYAITEGIQVDIVVTNISGTWYLYENTVLKSSVVFTHTTNNSSTDSIYRAANEYSKGVIKDLFVFNRVITTTEKDSYTNTPELFYAMAQADSTCVLNMPMCETDGYARNMKSYSEGSEEFQFNTWTMYGNNTQVDNGDGTYTITVVDNANGGYMRHRNIINRDVYMTTITDVVYSEPITNELIEGYAGTVAFQEAIGDLKPVMNASSTTYNIYFKNLKIGSTVTARIKTVKLSGIYPISNYTSSVRGYAKNLQYGLQTCKFVRDSLGVIQSASNYLECDGVGYGNTGWIPSSVNIATIEYICYIGLSGFYLSGTKTPNFRLGSVNGYAFFQTAVTSISTNTNVNNNNYNLLTMEYNQIADSINCYVNGVFVGNRTIGNISVNSLVFELGKTVNEYHLKTPIKLFKVHDKALTQAEITKNYNSYVAKGLLS